jgi:hypothetical protein
MRKLLILPVIVALAACGGSHETATEPSDTAAPDSAMAADTVQTTGRTASTPIAASGTDVVTPTDTSSTIVTPTTTTASVTTPTETSSTVVSTTRKE